MDRTGPSCSVLLPGEQKRIHDPALDSAAVAETPEKMLASFPKQVSETELKNYGDLKGPDA